MFDQFMYLNLGVPYNEGMVFLGVVSVSNEFLKWIKDE